MKARPAPVWLRYLLFQIPGWVLTVLALAVFVRWWGLPEPAAVALFGLLILKDVVMYPRVRIAYEPGHGRGADAALLGARGIAEETLGPLGYVRVGAELWRARVVPGYDSVPRGATVRVREVEGLTLVVEPDSGEPSP